MSYQTVLVHLDDTPRCSLRVQLAAQLALLHGSHLVGIAPTGLVNLPAEVGSDILQQQQVELGQNATRLTDRFALEVQGAGLSSFEASIVENEPLPAVVMRGRCCDLVVVGATDPEVRRQLAAKDFPVQVVLETGRPVLLIPHKGEFETLGQRVIVGWSPGRETARALSDALPFLKQATEVHLLFIDVGDDPGREARQQLQWADASLRRHGITAHTEVLIRDVDPGQALLAAVGDRKADLLVMGGYGHSRMAEFVFGGTTRTVLARMAVPVLMSH
ncbi:universal stress protein [Aquabacterium sp. A7-Y]|uniref:universal stress protein n=1 Tax=Aquabacterium sp. A7-Y TaxID=1349605 RepID=UPI00223DA1DB|nr:universal stress protein [Aquabacterium sp. A7-Y]MCW7541129.1 universal stress protein [Aquabacterium sp. A7-Y]